MREVTFKDFATVARKRADEQPSEGLLQAIGRGQASAGALSRPKTHFRKPVDPAKVRSPIIFETS